MRLKTLAVGSVLLTTLVIAACSGGGGSGGGSSNKDQATGPLSVPNATCGGSSCINKSSSLISPMGGGSGVNSKDAVLQYAGEIYSNFTDTIIPGINGILYKLEQAAAENDLKTCEDIAGAGDTTTPFDLGSGYSVDISSGTKSIPSPMVNSGTPMTKKFIFSYNTVKFAEAQIYCNSATQRTFYVRLEDENSNKYEFWSQVEGNKRTIFGAMDRGTEKYSLFFNTAAGTAFELHTVGKNVSYEGATVNFAIAGGASLSTGVADIGYAIQTATVPASLATASANEVDWDFDDIRHCYSSISAVTVTTSQATCSGLLNTPPAVPVRMSATAWSLSGMDSAISSTY